jgi:hypothetical protein
MSAGQGCTLVIAVSATAKIERQFGDNQPDTPVPHETPSLQTLLRSLQVQNYNLAPSVQPAEVTIEPDVTDFDLADQHGNWRGR